MISTATSLSVTLLIGYQFHFAFTCKPDSHLALYQDYELLSKVGGVHELTEQQWHNGQQQIWYYRYATRVPLTRDTKPLYVNWSQGHHQRCCHRQVALSQRLGYGPSLG